MGCCCSCMDGGDDGSPTGASETEMQEQELADRKILSIARGMSAPSIEVEDFNKVSGHGLALAAVVIEQDAAYYEVHVELSSGDEESVEIMVGVATKKDRKFYAALEEEEDSSPETNGTAFMRKIRVCNGDVVGVALQQSDLPMVQVLLNDVVLFDKSINRFKGTVYPAIYLPENEGQLSLRLVFSEKDFKKSPPSSRFYPVMVARGMI